MNSLRVVQRFPAKFAGDVVDHVREHPWVRYDWDAGTLRAVARWTNRRLWKYTPFDLYDPAAHRKPRTEDQTNLFEEL